MYTSYYSKNANNENAVSIAGKAPEWYKGKEYKKLAPKYDFFMEWKKTGDNKFYIEQYKKRVLDSLDPKVVYDELGENAILLCWESSEKFCHRHLVAEWLMENLGIEVREI